MSIFIPPKLKLSYGECNEILDLLVKEREGLYELAREGVGLQAIAADARIKELTALITKVMKTRDGLAGW